MRVKANIYCTPSMDCSYGDGLQLFQFANINNPSECEGYGDFTNLSTDLEQGQSIFNCNYRLWESIFKCVDRF